jgi:hypothetical protein
MDGRMIRQQPFCWQEKSILRLIDDICNKEAKSNGYRGKLRNLYLTLTQIQSDCQCDKIAGYTNLIHSYSGLPSGWIPGGLQILEKYNIILLKETRVKGMFSGKELYFTPEKASIEIEPAEKQAIYDDNSNEEKEDDVKKLDDTIKELLTCWNNQKDSSGEKTLKNHRLETVKNHFKAGHLQKIKIYELSVIKKAIENYSIVLSNEIYFWSHSWQFWDFISRGVSKFIDENDPLKTYLKNGKAGEEKKSYDYDEEYIRNNSHLFEDIKNE